MTAEAKDALLQPLPVTSDLEHDLSSDEKALGIEHVNEELKLHAETDKKASEAGIEHHSPNIPITDVTGENVQIAGEIKKPSPSNLIDYAHFTQSQKKTEVDLFKNKEKTPEGIFSKVFHLNFFGKNTEEGGLKNAA